VLSRCLPRSFLQAGLLDAWAIVVVMAAAFGKWLVTRNAGAQTAFPELIVSA
jgi:hypothetical protein